MGGSITESTCRSGLIARADYYFPRYLAVPPEQMFMQTYYNPFETRGQRYIPFAGAGGDHPAGGPPESLGGAACLPTRTSRTRRWSRSLAYRAGLDLGPAPCWRYGNRAPGRPGAGNESTGDVCWQSPGGRSRGSLPWTGDSRKPESTSRLFRLLSNLPRSLSMISMSAAQSRESGLDLPERSPGPSHAPGPTELFCGFVRSYPERGANT